MDRTVRRLAAILAADVVGYSGKIEADESSTLAALKDVRATTIDPLLAENSGRIVKTMGDGFIAEFGSVVDAVTFAVAMQKSVAERQQGTAPEKRLVYRIGINLGDVVVEGDDLLGDGVNVAARLQAAAEPGGICVSGSVYDQIRNKLSLTFRPLGEQSFKNIPQPVRAFSITESAERGALPAPRRWRRQLRRAASLAAVTLLPLAAGAVAWLYLTSPRVIDGLYAGPVCYGPSRLDPARCYRAQAVLSDGKLVGQWHGRDPVVTVYLAGEVYPTGAVRVEMHGEDADGNRLVTSNLAGTIRDGHLEASGTFEGKGRTVTIDWARQ
jgi:class 3 adenylate cyclase